MRRLIRPTLFLIARACLSLAVIAWLLSKPPYSLGEWSLPDWRWIPDRSVVYVNYEGWGFIYRSGQQFASVGLFLSDSDMEWGDEKIVVDAVGVTVTDDFGTRRISVRHYLAITFCALFYAVLKWAYRKRPTLKDE